jgi:hypothetical protein
MSDWSRRDLLRASGVAAVAVPMGVLSATSAGAAPAASHHHELRTVPDEPVMFCVHDARRGEVSILHGTNEVVVRDPQLVSRIMSAAMAQQAG